MISKVFSLRNYIMKQLMKTNKEGIIKIPEPGKVDFGEMIIRENLFKKGIDPKTITSERQLDNILNTPHVASTKPKKTGEVIDVDFDKGRWKDTDPEDFAHGGVAGLGERTGYYKGSMAESRPEKQERTMRYPPYRGPSLHRTERSHQVPDRTKASGHGVNFPYKSLEDIPLDVLIMLMKDPVFDLETFLKKVAWSDPDKTRIQKKIRGEKEPPWGRADHYGDMLLYKQKFGKAEPIGDGLLTLKSPSDADKVQTILHEMRHAKMREPWFMKSSAIPKYVRETDHPHYSFQKYGDRDNDPNKFVGGEELYIRYLDQLYGDVAEKGDVAGSEYKPYFDKILKEEWAPHAKAYKEILEEEKRVKSKPYGLAGGGRPGTGLNYLLGEDDQNVRMPFKKGHSAGRRKFLKTMAGLASIPFLGKFFKWAKPAAKIADVTSVPIGNAAGMPAWFKPLVNRVIKEGTDVTKQNAYKERVVVHKTKLPESKTEVYVHQDLDSGDVWVDIGIDKHGFPDGHLGQPVRLEYKASELIEPTHIENIKRGSRFGKTGKSTKTKEEFWVEEAEFTGGHPENVKFEESTFNKFGEHGSDFTEVEKFATGKVKKVKPTKKKLRTEYESGKAEADAERWTDEVDMASGGRVPLNEGGISDSRVGMLWGGGIFKTIIKNLAKERGVDPSTYLKVTNYKSLPREIKNIMSKADFEKMKAGRLEMFENWVEMAKTRQRFLKSIEEGKRNTPHAAPIFEHLDKVHKSPVPRTVTDKDILQGEFILKNLKTKGRKLNATGGRVPLAGGKIVGTILSLLKNKKKVRAAVDDIFPTGDYKYDAEIAAEALVENNPKVFGGKLIDDLDDATRMEIYGTVLRVVQSDLAKTLQLKRLSRPTKTLEGIEKTGTINISDEGVADEFTRFMKETDPKGHKKIEEIVEITNFDPKGRKKNASGGLAGMLGE